jgi:two-component system, response regulator RegA
LNRLASNEELSREREAHSVLVVDDDDVFRTRLGRAFADRAFEVRTARSAEEALTLARQDSPEFALVDLRMPGASGIDLVRELCAIDPGTVVVMLTGYGSIATAVEAIRAGAVHYLSKPVDIDQILAAFAGNAKASPSGDIEVPSLARVEWEHIQRVLADCEGNISRAARLLGLHRRSLQRKLSKDPVRR